MTTIGLTKEIIITNDGINSKGRACKLDYVWIGYRDGKCLGIIEGAQIQALVNLLNSVRGVQLAKAKQEKEKDEESK